jgi:hypothetical protein
LRNTPPDRFDLLTVLIAFAPVLARTLWSLCKPVTQVNLKRAGVLEIIYAMIFLGCLVLGFRAL